MCGKASKKVKTYTNFVIINNFKNLQEVTSYFLIILVLLVWKKTFLQCWNRHLLKITKKKANTLAYWEIVPLLHLTSNTKQ